MHGHQLLVVVSSDRGVLGLAKASGLTTFDPETEPLRTLTAFFRRASRN